MFLMLVMFPAPKSTVILKMAYTLSSACQFRKCFWCMMCALCWCVLAALPDWSVLCRYPPCLQWSGSTPQSGTQQGMGPRKTWTHSTLQRRSLQHCAWHCSVSENPLHGHTGTWSLWWNTVKSCSHFICPLHTPVYPVVEWSLKGTSKVFCPWRGIIPSFKCSPRRVTFSPSSTKGIPTPHCLISTPGLPLYSPQENHNQPGYTPANGADFEELRNWVPLFIKACNSQFFTIPPSMVLRECFSCENSMHCSLSLFPSPLCKNGSYPSAAPHLFSSPIPFSAPYTCHIVSLKLYRMFS